MKFLCIVDPGTGYLPLDLKQYEQVEAKTFQDACVQFAPRFATKQPKEIKIAVLAPIAAQQGVGGSLAHTFDVRLGPRPIK